MKKAIFSLTLVFIFAKIFGQTEASRTASKDYYLKKSKNQKTVGWVMLGGGVAMTTIGLVIGGNVESSPYDPLGGVGESGGAAIVVIAGIASALGSIPFFISSAKNKGRASTLSFSTPRLLLPQQNNLAWKMQPTLKLKIEL